MNIAIVGYGKMGRMIERLAVERGITVGVKIDEGDTITAAKFGTGSRRATRSPLFCNASA